MRALVLLAITAFPLAALGAPTARAAPASGATSSAAASAAAGATNGCRVAVMDLENQGLPADQAHLAKVLTEALAASVADVSGCEVVTRQDIASMIDFEAERAACGGSASDSCLSEIGNALGVERMVAGAVARVGTATTVTARLLNLKAGKVESRAEETTSDPAALRAAAQTVGKRLFGAASAPLTSTESGSSSGPSSGPSGPLLVGGVVVGVVGLVAAGVGGALALGANGVLADRGSTRAAKDEARDTGGVALAIVGVGVGVVIVGVVVGGLAFVLE